MTATLALIDELKSVGYSPQLDLPGKQASSFKNLRTYQELSLVVNDMFQSLFEFRCSIKENLDEIVTNLYKGDWNSWRRLLLDAPIDLRHQIVARAPFNEYDFTNPNLPWPKDYIR